MLTQLSSLIPTQRPAQLLGHADEYARSGVAHYVSAMSDRRSGLHASLLFMAISSRSADEK
ncbi:hypothetical protein AOQ72_03930 [Bradyrhizobium yuanmingense]|uniref:Uncharacterized protein n=1 Tax=Bradyrhizobium yuanmingense TaxID=108015 RepID=A0A0R3BTN9_9BRAD|nr:hypothetical protein AOQ72_03930 [Bradyrhizobium yuanmingense]